MMWAYCLILLQLIVVSWIDIKIKKISNWWSVCNFILGLGIQIFIWGWDFESLIFPTLTIIVGFIFFLVGIMGAGDSKYMASLFVLLPHTRHFEFFTAIVESTVVVGMIMLLFRIISDFKNIKAYFIANYWKGLLLRLKSKFSYAPVMLLAWILWGMKNEFKF